MNLSDSNWMMISFRAYPLRGYTRLPVKQSLRDSTILIRDKRENGCSEGAAIFVIFNKRDESDYFFKSATLRMVSLSCS